MHALFSKATTQVIGVVLPDDSSFYQNHFSLQYFVIAQVAWISHYAIQTDRKNEKERMEIFPQMVSGKRRAHLVFRKWSISENG